MNDLMAVISREHKRVMERNRTARELGYDDIAFEVACVEQLELLRDLSKAYLAELQRQWTLPRVPLKAALHRAIAAVEEDDADALTRALIEAADLLGGAAVTVRQLATLILEALEVGDIRHAEALALSALEDGATDINGRRRCRECGIVAWPGQLESHLHERRAA